MTNFLQYLDEIHKTEALFSEILSRHLKSAGIQLCNNETFEVILDMALSNLPYQEQFLKPISNWNRNKAKCYQLAESNSDVLEEEQNFEEMVEKTAIDGKVLLLTFSQK